MQRSDLVPIVTRLLRNTPGPELQAYFAQRSVEFPEPVDWNNGAGALLVPVRNAINALNEIDGARIRLDAEQVDRMTSEVGQTALMDVVTAEQRRLLCGKATRHGRALWLFLNDPQRFKRAEEASFFENARRGRTWDGFVARAGLEVSRETGHLQALASEIQRFFREGEKVNIEVFDRVRAQDGEVEGLVQVTVLREGLLDSVFAFNGEEPGPLVYQPAYELAFTYEPASGVIEVVAPQKARRTELAKMFAKALLGHAIEGQRVPLRQYDLSVFMEEREFDYDAEDGIDDVRLRMAKLETFDGRMFLTIEPRTEEETVHGAARERLGEGNPFLAGYRMVEVVLAIHFTPDAINPRGRTILIKLRHPNGCDLKDKTDKERLIGEKYLRRWHVIKDLID
jgi:hypothetical protein